MSGFIEAAVQLDTDNDAVGLIELVQSRRHDPHEMLAALWQLLPGMRVRPAFIVAMALANADYQDPVVSLALSVGGLLHGNPVEEARGLGWLRAKIDTVSVGQQAAIEQMLIYPVMVGLLRITLGKSDLAQMLRILEILKAAAPRFRRMFDWNATVPNWSLAGMRQRGWEQARLVRYALPPAGALRQRRRVVVATWRKIAEEVGLRVAVAMNAYGWWAEQVQCVFHSDPTDGCRAIVEKCRQHNADILVLPMDPMMEIGSEAYHAMIAQLQRDNASLKVVGILFDAWGGRVSELMAMLATHLDVVWTTDSPSLPVWNNPDYAHKMLIVTIPLGVDFGVVDRPLVPQMLFAGTVQGWNWPRAFWLAAMDHLGIPIKKKVSSLPIGDGLPPLESYALYIRHQAEATCCLSLTMRQNMECVVVGRSFDVLRSGALLVQETTPDMCYYFISGEHYLEFSTVAELSSVMRFITENREEAEEIRRRGHAFAREHYRDEKLIGYLDKLLYFPG